VKPSPALRPVPLSRTSRLERGKPLTARTGLQASGPWSRSVPLLTTARSATTTRSGPVTSAASPRRETGFSRSVKLKVRTRAGNGEPEMALCEACGKWLGRRHGECQHLVARGMGGTSDPLLSTPANAALLCRECHQTAESRDREMGARGFWLPQGTDPRMVPMMLASEHGSGVLVWRSEDGRYLFEAP